MVAPSFPSLPAHPPALEGYTTRKKREPPTLPLFHSLLVSSILVTAIAWKESDGYLGGLQHGPTRRMTDFRSLIPLLSAEQTALFVTAAASR